MDRGWPPSIKPYVGDVARWFADSVGNLGVLFLQFLLTVLVTAILYASGETAALGVRRFALRLAGTQGEAAVASRRGAPRPRPGDPPAAGRNAGPRGRPPEA